MAQDWKDKRPDLGQGEPWTFEDSTSMLDAYGRDPNTPDPGYSQETWDEMRRRAQNPQQYEPWRQKLRDRFGLGDDAYVPGKDRYNEILDRYLAGGFQAGVPEWANAERARAASAEWIAPQDEAARAEQSGLMSDMAASRFDPRAGLRLGQMGSEGAIRQMAAMRASARNPGQAGGVMQATAPASANAAWRGSAEGLQRNQAQGSALLQALSARNQLAGRRIGADVNYGMQRLGQDVDWASMGNMDKYRRQQQLLDYYRMRKLGEAGDLRRSADRSAREDAYMGQLVGTGGAASAHGANAIAGWLDEK